MKKKNTKNKGFTLIEMLVVVFIIALLMAVIVPGLSRFHNQQVLQNTTEDVVTLLNEARNNTISSKNSNTYGIHLETDRAILFTGTTFNSNDPSNVPVIFDTAAIIPATGGISLSGGGSNIIFNRITGETANYGTIIIRMASNATQQKSISISQIGVIGSN
jgi:prepilin-type N-terminal cleavage/methylation domain-containing protein